MVSSRVQRLNGGAIQYVKILTEKPSPNSQADSTHHQLLLLRVPQAMEDAPITKGPSTKHQRPPTHISSASAGKPTRKQA